MPGLITESKQVSIAFQLILFSLFVYLWQTQWLLLVTSISSPLNMLPKQSLQEYKAILKTKTSNTILKLISKSELTIAILALILTNNLQMRTNTDQNR